MRGHTATTRWPLHPLTLALLIGLWVWAPPALAQQDDTVSGSEAEAEENGGLLDGFSFDPVVEENEVDGLLLGAEAHLALFGLDPFVALGYGFDSGQVRYKVGVGWPSGWGYYSLSYQDWPDSPVLGRTGEKGVFANRKGDVWDFHAGFAKLWPVEEETVGPQVVYDHETLNYTFSGGERFSLDYQGQFTVGLLVDEGPFFSIRQLVNSRWGDFYTTFESGHSQNEAQLTAFEFTETLRGYDEPLKGHSFWRLRLERRVPFLTIPIELGDLFQAFPADVGIDWDALTFKAELSAFGEFLDMQPNPTVIDPSPDLVEPESRLGWGVGLVLSFEGLNYELRLDLFFNQLGEMKPLFG